MKRVVTVVTILAALAAAGAVQAQATKLRPGLWEHTLTMSSGGGEVQAATARLQERMARMPPERRQQMEAMMAQRGLAMGPSAGGTPAVRVCVTPEQAARPEGPRPDAHCKETSRSQGGSTIRFKFACEPRPGESTGTTGEGEFTLVSDREHRGKMTIDAVRQGQSQRVEMQSSGKWLQADCGDVKPLGSPGAPRRP